MDLAKRVNIFFREDSIESIKKIGKRSNNNMSEIIRFAVYEFIDRYWKDGEYMQYVNSHSSGITRMKDTLYISTNKTESELG